MSAPSTGPDRLTWTRMSALLDAALGRPPESRDAFLETACSDDPDLLARVRTMLARAAEPTFLEGDAARFAAPAWWSGEPAAALQPGGRIGPYRIGERIAVGGMSVVYRLERDDDQFRRTAVLKVLDAVGLDRAEPLRRFQAEQRILASLDHPNIASVYDGGATADGRPYLILEYVPGAPITTYCDRRGLSVNERLRLFTTVCRAVQHAHRRFIVHRDLKPGNILVRDDGTVKLLDFGIAKLLESDGAEGLGEEIALPLTRTGLQLLTPEYAAPEQIRHGTISSATDVYALGVLLYELLGGRRPYSLEGLSPREMESRICEEDPPRPSVRVAREGAGSTGLPAAALTRRLRGDLDTIIMTALRKEPDARYPSPEALADDVRRHLEGRAIDARSASVWYRSRRLVRRYRLALGAAALVVALGGFHLAQMTHERNLARREAAKSREVAAFLKEIFALADPNATRGATVTARDLLEQAASRIDHDLADQPAVRADMLEVLGDVHKRLSLYRNAEPLLREGLSLRRKLYGDRDPRTAEAQDLLGSCLLELGRYAEADSMLEQSLDIRREAFGDEGPEVATSYQNLGASALNQNAYARADSLLSRALELRRGLPGVEPREQAHTLEDLGMTRTAEGDAAAGEPLLREALATFRKAEAEPHSDLYMAQVQLGDNLSHQGRFDEAVPLLDEGTAGLEKILGSEHAEVAEGLDVLGITLLQSGEYDRATEALRRAVEIRRKLNGERHPDTARGLNDLAAVYADREDFAPAVKLFRRSLTINRALLGPDHIVVAINQNNLARCLAGLGRFPEAIARYDSAEVAYSKLLGPDNPRTDYARLGKAMARHRSGDLAAAEAAYRRLLPRMRKAYPGGSPRLALLLVSLGSLLRETGRATEALPYLQEGERMYLDGRGLASMQTAKAEVALAAGLADLGRYRDAGRPLRAGLTVEERFLPSGHRLLRFAKTTEARIARGLREETAGGASGG